MADIIPHPALAEAARLDPFARLREQRIVFLHGPIVEDRAAQIVAQLLALDADGDEPITLLIDSPGGDTFGMFAVHDVMQASRSLVHTRCVGMAASAGAFLLATGTGTRSATQNARIMIHQPHGRAGGQAPATDIAILAQEFSDLRARMERILSERTGQPLERVHADVERDFWLSADEARDYGLIDTVESRAR